ncbi:multiple epidermal growth factor-like domains protein 10 isoform X2 [Saccostrea cucullata]|uniref:multiple epidermal growth factor-like domains protein 10 isoform X2 n=1 Tax=Saccostrea cuccullata TaxID=36930 RepID=UPI002ED6825A
MQNFFILRIFITISIYRVTFGAEGCSSNFQKVGNECRECQPGYFGLECKQRCPPPTYGKLCGGTCDCATSECDYTHGCPNKEKACPPGYFNSDCSTRCPYPTYGFRCAHRCSCSDFYCNHVNGCLLTTESSQPMKRSTQSIDIVSDQTPRLTTSYDFKGNTLHSASVYHSKTTIILLIGISIICMLILYILYEILICRRRFVTKSSPRDCDTSENVYADFVKINVEDGVKQNKSAEGMVIKNQKE